MRWSGRQGSGNVEDRRGLGGRGMGLPLGGGIGGIVLLLIVSALTGTNPLDLIGGLGGPGGGGVADGGFQGDGGSAPPADDPQSEFIRVVLRDTEETFGEIFRQRGGTYQEPTLVLFSDATESACGTGQAAMGPFYCPGDRKVYLDTDFFDQLANQFGASGDFAEAYVIAHEVGHHVQMVLGILPKVQQAQQSASSKAEANRLQVRVELQADCFAGVWANHAQSARQILEQGDVEEAMNAAAKIGDDALQRSGGSAVVPESFTHGTSAQRQRWFDAGLKNGSIKACDTFSARNM